MCSSACRKFPAASQGSKTALFVLIRLIKFFWELILIKHWQKLKLTKCCYPSFCRCQGMEKDRVKNAAYWQDTASLVKLWKIFNCCEQNCGSSCSCGSSLLVCLFHFHPKVSDSVEYSATKSKLKCFWGPRPIGMFTCKGWCFLGSTQKLQGSWWLHFWFPATFPGCPFAAVCYQGTGCTCESDLLTNSCLSPGLHGHNPWGYDSLISHP